MAFGKRKRKREDDDVRKEPQDQERTASEPVVSRDDSEGPFDIEDFDDPESATVGRHDLGAVLIPVDESAELAVEVNPQGVPTMVWMVTPNGRYNVTAYAAPKTGKLWREVITEVAESLRNEGAQVTFEDGPWGREVVGLMTKGPEPLVMRFIGVDGYRWMIRGAAVAAPDTAEAIASDVRNSLTDTVVRRGDTPLPVRYMLPLELSESLVGRLRARAEQMVAQQAEQAGQQPPPAQPVARRSEQGSAMQQLRTITGG
jgi:uncharacterized protein YggU (UPF0235/DUF167 family)